MHELSIVQVEGVGPVLLRRRAYQRSLSVRMCTNGSVEVRAGRGVSDRRVHQLVVQQASWIAKQRQQVLKQQEWFPPFYWQEGVTLPLLGVPYSLSFVRVVGQKKVQLQYHQKTGFVISSARAWLPQKIVLTLVQNYYRKAAELLLPKRLSYWVHQTELKPSGLQLRTMRTQWGSCSSKGKINLNWKIIAMPEPVIDYILVHELAHIRHHNHSSLFWGKVEKYLPQYKATRQWLKQNAHFVDFLEPFSDLHASTIRCHSSSIV